MKKSVFLSYPRPVNENQDNFIKNLKRYLQTIELEPRTLGITDYDYSVPLQTIRSLMYECNGLLNVSFRRYKIDKGTKLSKDQVDKDDLNGKWFTSPYSQIEPAMAFQMGLPILIIREKDVIPDGMLELGAMANFIPEVDLDNTSMNFFETEEAHAVIDSWKTDVGEVYKKKGIPKKLY
ncbi:hypothetical protein [Lactiplantibacillus plantarum]|uniref:hypothetical protein n=1 Tax=Lactiplantibacillus plantarum TaxID=1590 RepID=UPI0018AD4CBE|nr:hypothetical protein [Lactiplantibacillus plantarum]WGF84237.1 hypothetical protein QB909_13355 [Lactiplantibacillus plantarum]WGG41562.1 hypothetical protein QCL57_13355 [Lactiplantibacillus plantarum]